MAPAEAVTAADREFLDSFEACTLPESEWTHLAHIRVAWVCLNLEPPATALERIREGILQYNTRVLDRPHRYHETVTVAYTRIVSARMAGEETWFDFSRRINDLLDRESPVLLRYYSAARLSSDAARQTFIDADRETLPTYNIPG